MEIENCISKIKNHIDIVFPKGKKIDVQVEETPNKKYRAKIQVRSPITKDLVATKESGSFITSLEKCEKAIIRQIHKVKNRQKTKQLKSRFIATETSK